jgi:K+-sensing histidine kinase KdpD
VMCVPLESRGEIKGVLCGYTQEGRVFTHDEVELIATIGHEISNAMETFDLIVETAEVKALREMDRLRSRLLSVVSHELRTPLTTIKGYATMLRDYDDKLTPDEKRQHVVSIDRSSDRLTNLIEQLLDMSRLESGTLKIQKAPTKISDLIQLAAREAQIRTSDHRIDLNLQEPLPPVNIDAKRIRQVVDNLIDNAIKYSMPETKVTVSAIQTGQELLISVADQGIGIAAKDLPKIFTPMYRVESRLSKKVGGLGLGLSICKGLVGAHGGRIWLESEKGKGSTCFFTLPVDT